MTREEAIYQIKQLAVLSTDKDIPKITEALDTAIEALTEPSLKAIKKQIDEHWYLDKSGDLISRADAIEAVAKLQKYDLDERNRLRIYAPWHNPKRIFVETEAIYKTIYTLPSAVIPIPQDLTTEQWDKYIEECRLLRETLSADRPSGEWIRHEDYGGFDYWECSNCKEEFYFEVEPPKGYNYCPSCGAYMKGGGE